MPVGAHSHIGIGKETTFGTPVAATKYVPFISESISANVEQVLSASNRGIYEESPSYNGAKTFAGDIVFDAHPNILGDFLRSALGAPVTTQPDDQDAPTVYQHVFTPVQTEFSTTCDVPPYSIEVNRDSTSAWQYAGAVVNSLQLQVGAGQKLLRATANMLAKGATSITKTSASFETTRPFLFNELAVEIGGSAYNDIEDLTLTITNNLEGVLTLSGSRDIAKIRRNGYRQYNLQFTIDYDGSLDQYNALINGTETSMELLFTGPVIEDVQTYKLLIEIPKLRYTAVPVNIGGPGRVTVQVAAVAKYSASDSYALRTTLTNTVTAY